MNKFNLFLLFILSIFALSCNKDNDPIGNGNQLNFDGKSYQFTYAKIIKSGPADLGDYGINEHDFYEYILELADGDVVDGQIPENKTIYITVSLYSKEEFLSEGVLTEEKYAFNDLSSLPPSSFFYPLLVQYQGDNFYGTEGSVTIMGNEPNHRMIFSVNFADNIKLTGRIHAEFIIDKRY